MSPLSAMSLRSRVSLLAAVGVGAAVALVAAAAYLTVRVSLNYQVDHSLLERARAAASSGLTAQLLAQVPSPALGAADVEMAFLAANGFGTSAAGQEVAELLGPPELAVARGSAGQSVRTATMDGQRYRVVAVPAGPGFAFVLAQSTRSTDELLNRLGLVMVVVGGAGVLLAAIAGLGIARVGLRPVDRLTQAAEHVARTEDLRPIPVRGRDELARLTGSFNAMLGALAEARLRQRRLVADAGHELRTPLTSLRTNLDLLAQSEQEQGLPATERDALLADVRAQIEELSTLVGDLVELSREDSPREARVPLDLADVVTQALGRAHRRAANAGWQVRIESWPMLGDPQSLSRMVTNLLDNAVKWNRPGGTITVRLGRGELEVVDQGPGIAAADLPHVFERFYRSQEARTMPGSGLGLAIVAQAAGRHGGTVHAGPGPGGTGTRIVVRLPDPTQSSAAAGAAPAAWAGSPESAPPDRPRGEEDARRTGAGR